MTQEDKQLLLKDLCGRLPYGVKCLDTYENLSGKLDAIAGNHISLNTKDGYSFTEWRDVKPYLRPMSSMTEEEEIAYLNLEGAARIVDWLNKHHFDYRRLIKKGLAIEAPEDMYNLENK